MPLSEDAPWPDLARVMGGVAEAEDRAAQAFSATLEFASGEVAVRWADPLPPIMGPGGRAIVHMPVFDARYPIGRGGAAADPRWGRAHLEWSFGLSEVRDDHSGEVAFGAGLAVPLGDENTILEDPDWLAALLEHGFERLHNSRLGVEQLLRWLDMDAVLAAGEPVEQADLVADWVVATFEDVVATLPARG